MEVLKVATERYGRKAVVLIDEYDKPLLDVMNTPLEQTNRDILKGFYSVFKLCDEYLQFVMLTGVTKFSQISVFSGFNQPDDISMDPRYDALCGITQAEFDSYFTERIQEMAAEAGVSIEKIKDDIKRMYDGYHFSERMTDIYNPFSLLNALSKGILDSFWFRTGTPTYLVKLVEDYNENINEMVGRFYSTSQFIDYKADKQLPLPMIYQSGYLTIKKFNPRTRSFKLDFPNDEVKEGFISLIASTYFKANGNSQSWIFDAVDALDEGNLETFRKLLTAFLAGIPYSQRRRADEKEQERDFQYTFYLIIKMISSYLIHIEKETSEGRADCVIETDAYVYIFEFKRDGTAAEALAQIEAKGYACEYTTDSRKVYRIGCNFSTTTGTISDWAVQE